MRFVYKPEGAEPRSWDFAPDRLLNVEAIAIEKVTGLTLAGLMAGIKASSMTAITGLLWVLLKRGEPSLRFEQVQFSLSEVDFEVDDDEAADILASLEAKQDRTDDEQAALDLLHSQGVTAAPKG